MKEIKWYISDDGTTKGTQAEVEAYEAALNPLAKYAFPYHVGYIIGPTTASLLNLMPLVEEVRQTITKQASQWRTAEWQRDLLATQNLLLAYEKALGIEQPS